MTKKTIFWLLATILLTSAVLAQAQQTTKIPKIGFLYGASRSGASERIEPYRLGLREHGYVERKNIVMESRYAEGNLNRLDEFASEFARLKVDVIVTAAQSATRAARKATSTIPIVMTNDSDPVADGFVASLARPGGNITGLSNFAPELNGKRFEILTETVPKLARVAVLRPSNLPTERSLRQMELAAKALKIELQYLDVGSPKDIEIAFREARKGRAGAVLVLPNPVLVSRQSELADLAAKNRLPVMYHQGRFVEAGGLMYYGVNLPDLDRRAATYVDKILKGAKPADLPVEQPMKFNFVINLKAAKAIGLTIPPNVLVRADRVIK